MAYLLYQPILEDSVLLLREVSTGSGSDRVSTRTKSEIVKADPVATAPGTDLPP